MPNIETVSELTDKLADWLGIYGGCKNDEESANCENVCVLDTERPFCCRNGFAMVMEEQIRESVENEKLLENR